MPKALPPRKPAAPPAKAAKPLPPAPGSITAASRKTKMPAPAEGTETIPVLAGGTVHIEKGFTKNLDNYESARITIGVTLPIDGTVENTIKQCNEVIDAELEKQVNQIEEARA